MGPTSATSTPPARKGLAPDLGKTPSGAVERSAAYWCGVRTHRDADPEHGIAARPHPPCVNFEVGGVTFASMRTPWDDSIKGRHALPGDIVVLTTSRVARLETMLRRTIVRWRERTGSHPHGYPVTLWDEESIEAAKVLLNLNPVQVQALRAKVPTAAKTFETDEPIAKYLYCVKVTASGVREGSTYRPAAELPPSLLEQGFIEAP